MKSIGWIVTLNGKKIDKVFYDIDCDAEYVRRGLIEHDGYDPRIKVKRERALTQAEKNSLIK
jgi:hypothetical protein